MHHHTLDLDMTSPPLPIPVATPDHRQPTIHHTVQGFAPVAYHPRAAGTYSIRLWHRASVYVGRPISTTPPPLALPYFQDMGTSSKLSCGGKSHALGSLRIHPSTDYPLLSIIPPFCDAASPVPRCTPAVKVNRRRIQTYCSFVSLSNTGQSPRILLTMTSFGVICSVGIDCPVRSPFPVPRCPRTSSR